MIHSTRVRRSLLVGAATIAVSASVIGGSVAANAATSSSAASAEEHAEVRAVLHALPASLRSDVTAAVHQKSKEARHDALVKVDQKAIAGGYGQTVETIAKDVQSDWSSAPTAFKHQATRLVDGRRGDRMRELRGMVRRALAGKYGDTIKQQVTSLASSLPAAPAKTPRPTPSAGS